MTFADPNVHTTPESAALRRTVKRILRAEVAYCDSPTTFLDVVAGHIERAAGLLREAQKLEDEAEALARAVTAR